MIFSPRVAFAPGQSCEIMDHGFNCAHKENEMSGWQRLGVVLSVVIALLAISMTYDSFPTQKQAYLVLSERAKLWVTCEEYFGNMDGQEKAIAECSTYARQHADDKLIAEVDRYKERTATLTVRQMKFVGYYFAWWIGISLIMYLIAISIKWVYRGFRPKKV